MTQRQVLLNTLVILMPGDSHTSTIDRGIRITVYPSGRRKPSNVRLQLTSAGKRCLNGWTVLRPARW
jgi:hypothetical protein